LVGLSTVFLDGGVAAEDQGAVPAAAVGDDPAVVDQRAAVADGARPSR
jgi:hypothetical protein